MRALVPALLVAVAALFAGSAARAQMPAAEALFQEGRTLIEKGKIAEACEKFAASERLESKIGTLLNLADCHEREGKTATAWAEFNQVYARAFRANQTDRQELADERIRALLPRLSRVALKPERVYPGMTARLDDIVLDAASFGTAIPLDPGEHPLEVTAPGRRPYFTKLRVEPKPGTVEVTVHPLESDPASTTREPPAQPQLPRASVVMPAPLAPFLPAEDTRKKTAGWLTLGGSALAIGAGAFFGVRAIGFKNDSLRECDLSGCSQSGLDLHSDARVSANASTIAFGVGLVAAAVGVYLLLTSDVPRREAPKAPVTLAREPGSAPPIEAPPARPQRRHRIARLSSLVTTDAYYDIYKVREVGTTALPAIAACLTAIPDDAGPTEDGPTWSAVYVVKVTALGAVANVTSSLPTPLDPCVIRAIFALRFGPTDARKPAEMQLNYSTP